MPSKQPQLNARVTAETNELFRRLVDESTRVAGVPLSQSQVLTLAIQSLAEKWLLAEAEKPAETKRRKSG